MVMFYSGKIMMTMSQDRAPQATQVSACPNW